MTKDRAFAINNMLVHAMARRIPDGSDAVANFQSVRLGDAVEAVHIVMSSPANDAGDMPVAVSLALIPRLYAQAVVVRQMQPRPPEAEAVAT